MTRRQTGPPGYVGWATLLAGGLLTAGLILAQRAPARPVAAGLAAGGVLIGLALLARRAADVLRTQRRARRTLVALLLLALVVAGQRFAPTRVPVHLHLSPGGLGRLLLQLVPAGVSLAAATAGLVLLADEARARVSRGQAVLRPWELLSAGPDTDGPVRRPWRAVAGTVLLAAAGVGGVLLSGTYLHDHLLLELLVAGAVALTALAGVMAPVAVGALTSLELARVQRGEQQERERLSAHLHDSVLQTLALVRRQADDPVAVDRLAREQERRLRSWMSGQTAFDAPTLASALRQAAEEANESLRVNVHLAISGDRALDPVAEALAGSAREALRNAARHAPNANVFLLAQIREHTATVFVRDDGPGFDLDLVPAERRGLRDSVVRRMQNAGGGATIETSPGAGTEITLQTDPRSP